MDSNALSFPESADEFVCDPPMGDADVVHAGIDHFGVAEILDAVARAVEEADSDTVHLALGLLREGFLTGHRDLRTAYQRSDVLGLLRSKLYSPRYAIRRHAIYALGKLGPRENARHLRAAFPWYIEHDPLNLWSLLFELKWLTRRNRLDRRRLMTEIATSSSYLTRWVGVMLLWETDLKRGRLEFGARRSPGWAVQLMRRLAQDPHPSVRRDARVALAERRRLRLAGPRSRPIDPHVIRTPELDHVIPRISRLERSVGNYLHCSGEPDYDVELVEAVARHTEVHPITVGYDPAAYWAPLADARLSSSSSLA